MKSKNTRTEVDNLSEAQREVHEDMTTDHVGGLINITDYETTTINLQGFKLTRVLDDILMVQYVDSDESGDNIMRGGLLVPNVTMNAWRLGKVILSGPRSSINVGEYVIFPNDRGIKCSNINGLKNVVFLSEGRIFGVAEPQD